MSLDSRLPQSQEELKAMLDTAALENLGTLSSALRHDTNNLLAVINGNSELGKMQSSGLESADVQHYFDKILDASDSIKETLAYLTDITNPPAALSPDDLYYAINRAVLKVEQNNYFNKNTMSIDMRTEKDSYANMDSRRIEQALFQLGKNAAQAILASGKNNGKIEYSIDSVTLGADNCKDGMEPGEYWAVSVKDNGAGVSEEYLDRVFDPFFTTEKSGKKGLGLTYAQQIAKQHNGFVELESRVGEGTKVTMYLKAIESLGARETRKKIELSDYMGAGEKILVVDDEDGVRNLTAQMLRELGYSVITASDGQEAIELYQKQSPAMVIMDYRMPNMNGLEAFNAIKSIDSGVKTVFCSGEGTTPSEVTEAGALDYLQKPFRIREIALAVKNALAHKP